MINDQNTAQALSDFSNSAAMQADETAQAFEQAGERIAKALEQAALKGEFSMKGLVQSVAQDLTRLAVSELFVQPLSRALGGTHQGPNQGVSKPSVSVNMTVNGVSDAQSFARSQTQISTGLARAVSAAQKYL